MPVLILWLVSLFFKSGTDFCPILRFLWKTLHEPKQHSSKRVWICWSKYFHEYRRQAVDDFVNPGSAYCLRSILLCITMGINLSGIIYVMVDMNNSESRSNSSTPFPSMTSMSTMSFVVTASWDPMHPTVIFEYLHYWFSNERPLRINVRPVKPLVDLIFTKAVTWSTWSLSARLSAH